MQTKPHCLVEHCNGRFVDQPSERLPGQIDHTVTCLECSATTSYVEKLPGPPAPESEVEAPLAVEVVPDISQEMPAAADGIAWTDDAA